jgi:DUF1680 family protein
MTNTNRPARHACAVAAALFLATTAVAQPPSGPTGLKAVPFQDVKINDSFWSPRIRTNQRATIEANLRQCELTGRIKNFAVAGKLEPGKHEGMLYNDSDVYKVLEGIAYTLSTERDPELERRTDAIIDKIAAAQQPDGYINTYYTLVKPQDRWKNIQHGHEMYCAGHLIEAAVAYQQATGKDKLLGVARRMADHICSVFGPGKRPEPCGHQEIELALVKLGRVTGDRKYLDQALHFLNTRGRADRGSKLFGEYAQDHRPVREQNEVVGHAVRAMYMYCAMADVAAATGDAGLRKAIETIWHDVVDRKMYVTGGIGPSASNEGFTVPYDLPNDSAYAETCAAIGMALWNHRMFLMSGEGRYADILEREVYNGLLSGVSLTGDKFFYVNPLGSVGTHHRVPWFDCSCCPTNIVRYLPGMGERVYATKDNDIWTVLYLGNEATVALDGGSVKLKQETRYPWDGLVKITVEPEKPFAFALHLRIPGWCKARPAFSVRDKNGKSYKGTEGLALDAGYLTIKRTWQAGDVVEFGLPMPVERVYADPRVKADVGRVALMRGPVVYCLEGVDNNGSVRNLVLPKDAKLTAAFDKDLLGGVIVLRGEALAVTADKAGKRQTRPIAFQAVPYSYWDNRAPGPMVVWLPETPDLAELPGEGGSVEVNGVRLSASHVYASDTLTALNDDAVPKASSDKHLNRMTWWDHKGTTEWVVCKFPEPRTVSASKVYWYDDTGTGRCRAPASWRLLYLDGNEWKPVAPAPGSTFGTALDRFNEVRFEPVKTQGLKLEAHLKAGYSGGILKWLVANVAGR